ncbi:MAG: Gfo/Idh/MocA family oxidoreductase, partial [Armatimonadetes bacterium]|nr:Gfo/Idh/MocA family oxidoreductase [Armatimonadota bacterium]
MTQREVGIGLVGYAFMGKAHSNAWRQVRYFFDPPLIPRLSAICGRSEEKVRAAAEKLGWAAYETDWNKLIARDDVQIVDVSTANDTHAPISIAAANAGKAVFCEKPLARTAKEAEEMLEAVVKAGVPHGVCFNYRRAPAVQLAKELIASGRMGKVFHFRGTYLQDWIVDPNFPLVWRLRKSVAGSGALGDLAAHVVDLARFLVGEIVEVVAYLHTFITERPLPAEEVGGLTGVAAAEKGTVDVDDASLSIVTFENGAIGYVEATRFAPGRKNYNR